MPEHLYDILITAIPHRQKTLLELLAALDEQLREPGTWNYAGAILYRDNLTVPYGDKTRALLEASSAQYVSCVDDDDLLAPDAVALILDALVSERPDYVGFPVRWTRDGVPQARVEHSLRHGGWSAEDGLLKRDLSEKNPIRRELAMDGRWEGGYQAEFRWANQVRAAGRVKTEAWIPEPLYWYRESTADTFNTPRQPWPAEAIEPLPAYPWLAVLLAEGSC